MWTHFVGNSDEDAGDFAFLLHLQFANAVVRFDYFGGLDIDCFTRSDSS